MGRGDPHTALWESSHQAPPGAQPGVGRALESLPRGGRLGHPARSQRALGRVRLSTLIPINSDFNTLAVCAQMHAGKGRISPLGGCRARGSRPVILSNESYRCREARAWVEAAQRPRVQAAGRGTRQPDPCCPFEPVGGNAGGLWTSQRMGGPGWLGGRGAGSTPLLPASVGTAPGLSLISPCPSSPLRWSVRLPLCPGKAYGVSF